MVEITPRDGTTRQSIAPSAEGAPTMTPQGVTTVTDPVSSSSRQRESEVEKKFAAIEKEYERSKYLRHRRDSMKLRAAPKTPVSDEYVTVIRSKTPTQERREMLDQLVIREEQLKRGQWLQEEEIRAAVLPYQLREEQQYLAQMEYNAKVAREYDAARRERQEAVAEAQRYGYDSPEALQAAIREEKAIKRANELGLALTEAQIIAQTVAREGYSGAAIQYGRDPGELIAEQAAKAKAAQSSLAENFGIEADPRHQGFFQEASDFTATVAAQQGATPLDDNRIRLTNAGMSFKTSDYPAPPTDLKQGTVRLVKDADGSGWNVEPSTQSLPTAPKGGELSERERILKTPSFLLSPVGQFAQDVFKDQEAIAQAESDYEEAYRRYEERLTAAEGAGLIVGDEFLVSDQATQLQYDELKIAAEAVDSFGKEAEDLRKRELFGIPYRFGEMESSLAGALNLPALSKEEARALTKAQELSWAVMPLIGSPRISPEVSEIKAGVLSGAYSGVRDRPLTGIASLGIGFAGGLAMKGLAKLPTAGKGVAIGLKGVEAVWVGTVGARTGISGHSGGLFAAGETFGGILSTEALPVIAGAAAVPRVTSAISGVRAPRSAIGAGEMGEIPSVKSGWYPSNEMILEGLRMQDVRGAAISRPSARSLSRAGTFVEVGPGRYVERGQLDTYLRRFEIESPARKPIPPEYLAAEDIVGIPRSMRAEVAITGEAPRRGMVGGWYPSNEMILEGLRMQDVRGAAISRPSARSLSRAGTFVEVGPGRYVERGQLDTYLRRFEIESPARKPIPPEYLAAEDIVGIPPQWEPGTATVGRPVYSGIPIRTPRPIQLPGKPRFSVSGRSPRIRPATSMIRPELGVVPSIRITPAVQVASDTRMDLLEVPALKMMMESKLESEAAIRERLESAWKLEPDVSEIVRVDDKVGVVPAQAVSLRLDQESIVVQMPRIGQIPTPRIRSPDPIRRPHVRIEQPPPPPGFVFPDGLNVKGFGDDFYIHYAERPTAAARLEEAYTNLQGPKIRRARVIENIQRITIGEPPRTPRRAIVSRVGPKVRRARQEVPWDIDLGGMFRSAPKRRKRKRR